MLSVIHKAVRTLDRLLEGAVAAIFFGMVVLIILLVILRYFFNRSIPGGYEALRFAFMYTTFLGSAVLLSRREHIGIELLTKHLPPKIQRILDITGHSLILAVHVYLLILSFRWIAVTGKNRHAYWMGVATPEKCAQRLPACYSGPPVFRGLLSVQEEAMISLRTRLTCV